MDIAEIRKGQLTGLEGDSFVIDDDTGGLVVVVPRSPLVDDRLAEAFNPALSADSGNRRINVTAEDKNAPVGFRNETLPQGHNRVLVLVAVKDLADPVPVGGLCVDGSLNIGLVKVVDHVVINAGVESGVVGHEATSRGPLGVVLCELRRGGLVKADGSVDVIRIEDRGQEAEGSCNSLLTIARRIDVIAIAVGEELSPAAGLVGGEVLRLGDDHVLVEEGKVSILIRSAIPVRLGTRIAHHDTFHVQPGSRTRLDAVKDLGSQLRAVLSSVGLSSNVKVVGLVLRVEGEPVKEELVVLLGSLVVVGDVLHLVIRVGEAHTNGCLKIDDIGNLVPRVIVQ